MSLGNQNIQFYESFSLDMEGILRDMQSATAKLEGLNKLAEALSGGCSTASFLSCLERLFTGFRGCLTVDQDSEMEIILRANSILVDMLPDIQHSDDLEIQFAQLLPIFIDNLGSSKAVIRKSTHKCIATYVKMSKKLEFVMLNIIHSGFESTNSRTRQHSMLVIPALLSLKPSVVEKPAPELIEMIKAVNKRLKDPQDLVAKTARKLLIEINKCYPQQFENQIIGSLRSEEDKLICRAALRNDEQEIIKAVEVTNQSAIIQQQYNFSKRSGNEESKYGNNMAANSASTLQGQSFNNRPGLLNQGAGLSVVGKEILQSSSTAHGLAGAGLSTVIGSTQVFDKILSQAKEESRYPLAQNGYYFGFLDEATIDGLSENNQWKERTSSIEAIESKLNQLIASEKKVDFMPYSNHFLGFMIQFIPDINFKISLSSIKIISKLLQLELVNLKKHYQQLVSALIEKLSDSKVTIRQSVMMCCAQIINNQKPCIFAFHTMRYLQHNNWHVREGAIQLIAHCVLNQSQSKNNSSEYSLQNGPAKTPDMNIPLTHNPSLVQEIVHLSLTEDKQKNQGYLVDLLALIIDKSSYPQKTKQLIQKCMSITPQFPTDEDAILYTGNQKEQSFYKQVVDRYLKGNLPYINEDQMVEFPNPSSLSSNLITQKSSNMGKQLTHLNSTKNATLDDMAERSAYPASTQNQETIASNMTKAPSENFMEMKRKQQQHIRSEEEKKFNSNTTQPHQHNSVTTLNQQVNGFQPTSFYSRFSSVENRGSASSANTNQMSIPSNITSSKDDKISMWLPSFNNLNSELDQKKQEGSLFKQTPVQGKQHSRQSQNLITTMNDTSDNMSMTQNTAISQQELNSFRNSNQSSNINQTPSVYGSSIDKFGYTPEAHNKQPRAIQSNEIRQRLNNNEGSKSDQDYFKYQNNTSNTIQSDLKQHSSIPYQRNMSQSTGGPAGFNQQNPYVSDRLKLLKSNQKYKENTSIGAGSPEKLEPGYFDSQEDLSLQHNLSEQVKSLNQPNFPSRKIGSQPSTSFNAGPVKANHEFLQTISNDDTIDQNFNVTPNLIKTKKPPLTQKQSSTTTKVQTRAQSVDNSNAQNNNDQQMNSSIGLGQQNGDMYSLVEEPLPNPEKLYQQSLDLLKTGDWSKQFEACSTLKRVAIFHKQLLATSNPLQSQIVKELVKLVDSLRSQLSKQTLITLKTMIESLQPRDMDPHIDTILPAVLKKAADTNVFISESADACLVAVCSCLSEAKVFTTLQSTQNVKSNAMKVKLALCYNALIEKLGPRLRQFANCDKIVQAVVGFLNEGAIEVRNVAKIGLFTMKNIIGSQRELEGILNRYVSNEKQLEKIKQILDRSDIDSISNVGSTRYGSSMRNSSLETRSAGAFRGQNPQITAAGSDGFGKYTQSSDFNMQQTFLKSSVGGASSSGGFNSTSNTFKKQNNLVAKPIDPMLMEEFKQIINELGTNDWNKRLKSIDTLCDFVKTNILIIKSAPPAKFIQLIDAFCKVLNDNNAKVLSYAQQTFRTLILNENLRGLIEQNLTMIIQALNNNLQSTNFSVREQGEILFGMLEGAVDPNLLIPPLTAQINLANNRSKLQLIERLINLMERVDKTAVLQKYVQPLTQQSNKIYTEASSNQKLKEALQNLTRQYQICMSGGNY